MSSPMYSVSAFINDTFIFQSDIFGTREQANEIMNLLKNTNTGDIAFQLYKHFPRGRLINGTKTINYSSMNLYNHDSLPFTYILEAPLHHYLYGIDGAVFNGEWSEEYMCWILNQNQARLALEAGVNKDLFDDNIEFDLDELKCMTIFHIEDEKYLLEPHPECSVLPQKHFCLGKWKSKHGGWVIKGDDIINYLNTTFRIPFYTDDDDDEEVDDYEEEVDDYEEEVDDDEVDDDEEEVDDDEEEVDDDEEDDDEEEVDDEVYTYDKFTIERYKRGLIMKCPSNHPLRGEKYLPSNHPLRGEKYLSSGFWNKTLGGWVFKQNALEELQANGAKLIKVEQYDKLFSTMTFTAYGKGFLVYPPTDHPDFGEKYYHDGFWMPKKNAWFFRGRFEEFIRSSGATEI